MLVPDGRFPCRRISFSFLIEFEVTTITFAQIKGRKDDQQYINVRW